MGKKIRISILVTILLLLVLCLVPNPLSKIMAADGGTMHYHTIIPVIHVTDWNHFEITAHNDPDYPRGKTTMGKTITVFGVCVYDGRHTVPGTIRRSERKHYKNNLQKSIVSESPFTIAGDAYWKMYPKNNQAGLIAAVSEHDGQADRMILVLDKSAAQKSSKGNIRSIVLWHDFFRVSYTGWEDSWRDQEKKDVYESEKYLYLRAQFDSRATLKRIKIGTGASDSIDPGYGEGVIFDFSDPFEITLYSYGGNVITMSQIYNEKKSAWNAVTTDEGIRTGYD